MFEDVLPSLVNGFSDVTGYVNPTATEFVVAAETVTVFKLPIRIDQIATEMKTIFFMKPPKNLVSA
jgi:hypothetical protein